MRDKAAARTNRSAQVFANAACVVSVIERLIRSMKRECTRRVVVALHSETFRRELDAYVSWFNGDRPHSFLGGATRDEVYFHRMPACRRPRIEPRPRWPRRAPCAWPSALVRGRPGGRALELVIESREARKHLPTVTLRRVA